MKTGCFALGLVCALAAGRAAGGAERWDAVYGQGPQAIGLATGSPGELGLLETLAQAFSKRYQAAVCWKKAGSGEALALLKEGKVDIALVHAPQAERRAVAEGFAVDATLVGCNEFVLVGPANDPAGVSQAASAVEAYRLVARAQARFLSRGDNSGTQQKEAALWRQAGIAPGGDWYVVTAGFMRTALERADKQRAYFMTDSSTWIALRAELRNLKVLFRGDPGLVNVYHALRRREPQAAARSTAADFLRFLGSEEAQALIREFGKARYGEPLYRDAAYAKAFEAPEHAPHLPGLGR